jgi:N utilization substance protein B
VKNLFSLSFNQEASRFPTPHATETKMILEKKDILDAAIEKHALRFPIEKIAKVDLAIMRLALYELMIEKKNPPKVVINEAVELARELGGDQSYAFVNGILGKIVKNLNTPSV